MLPPEEGTLPCAACNQLIQSGQVLLALDTQWHIWCFKCSSCEAVLHGEYMAKDNVPYCVRDYNAQFGLMCYECSEYITGKVLQAGDYYFHPPCAECSRCGSHFEEKEEMYMQGDEIWHSRCNDLKPPEKILYSRPAPLFYRHCYSYPCLHNLTRSPKSSASLPKYTSDFGKHLTYMYSVPEQHLSYLRQPIGPHMPQAMQYHLPQQGNLVKIRKSRYSMFKTSLQKLAEVLVEQQQQQQPRPHSPHMDNEEPIEMSHYPGAQQPSPNQVPAIERDDFPAPPYPYAVEELKRRLSSSDLEDEDEPDHAVMDEGKIRKAEDELKKIENESSIAKIVIHNLEERTKKVKAPLHWDPRSASRTPSAKKLPLFKCRYDSPINASPSRFANHPRPWHFDKAATVTIPYAPMTKSGHGGFENRAATLPGAGATNGFYESDYPDMNATRSSGFSEQSFTTIPNSLIQYDSLAKTSNLRRSLPDMTKTPKIYVYGELVTTNKDLPEDVDRCHLERHLSKEEFQDVFGMTPIEFYKLQDWKRINLKRRAKLY